MAIKPVNSNSFNDPAPVTTSPSLSELKVQEAVEGILRTLNDQGYVSLKGRNSFLQLLRNHLTARIQNAFSKSSYEPETFKSKIVEEIHSISQTCNLVTRVYQQFEVLHKSYYNHPHFQLTRIFLEKNEAAIATLLENYLSSKNFSAENLEAFKRELQNLANILYRTFYPNSSLKELNKHLACLQTGPVTPNEMSSYINKIQILLLSDTLKTLVSQDRQQKLHFSGGTCFGDCIVQMSPLVKLNPHSIGSYLQNQYATRTCYESVFDPNRVQTGKLILENIKDFPTLEKIACLILNCEVTQLHSQNTFGLQMLLGRIGVLHNSKNSNTSHILTVEEQTKLTQLRVKSKSSQERATSAESDKLFAEWILKHRDQFHSIFKDLGSHNSEVILEKAFDCLFNSDSSPIVEKRKLRELHGELYKKLPSSLLTHFELTEETLLNISEDISELPSVMRKLASDQTKIIMKLNGNPGHALTLSFGQNYSFSDPNIYDPSTLLPVVFRYGNVEDLIDKIVFHLFYLYENYDFESFNISKFEPLMDESKRKMSRLARWMDKQNTWMEWKNNLINKIEQTEQRLSVDHSLTSAERNKLLNRVHHRRMALEEDGAELARFHDEFRVVIEERMKHYQAKLSAIPLQNSKLKKSYEMVIQSYLDLLKDLCSNPQALVRYKS